MSKNRLIIEMTIFTACLFVCFSLIIINEKSKDFLAPKVDEKLRHYVEKTYSEKKEEFIYTKTKYNQKNERFEMRINNQQNSHLYFTLHYKKKKITSSYQEDYVEGKTLLSYWQKQIEAKIQSKTYSKIKVQFCKKLNQYNQADYHKLLTSKEVYAQPLYELTTTLHVKKFNQEEIIHSINQFYTYTQSKNIHPKYYHFQIICSSTEDKIKIERLSESDILSSLDQTIHDIMVKKSSN